MVYRPSWGWRRLGWRSVHQSGTFCGTVNAVIQVNMRIRNALWSVLSEIASDVDVSPPDPQGVFKARIRVGRSVHVANVLWAGEGWPEDVSRVLTGPGATRRRQAFVVAAHRLSPGSLDRISRVGFGWVDEQGAARVVLPSGLAVHTHRKAQPAPPLPKFVWTPAAIAVGEAILTSADMNVRSLSGATGVSIGRISRILQAFDAEGFTRKLTVGDTVSAREIADREALLKAWVGPAGTEPHDRWMLTSATGNPLDLFVTKLVPLLGAAERWALTGPAAANLEAPYLAEVPVVHAYVDADFPARLQTMLKTSGLLPVDRGGRFEFWSASSATLRLARRAPHHPNLMLADLPRVYADLLAMGARYEEAGGHLRELTNLGW